MNAFTRPCHTVPCRAMPCHTTWTPTNSGRSYRDKVTFPQTRHDKTETTFAVMLSSSSSSPSSTQKHPKMTARAQSPASVISSGSISRRYGSSSSSSTQSTTTDTIQIDLNRLLKRLETQLLTPTSPDINVLRHSAYERSRVGAVSQPFSYMSVDL